MRLTTVEPCYRISNPRYLEPLLNLETFLFFPESKRYCGFTVVGRPSGTWGPCTSTFDHRQIVRARKTQ